MQHHTQRDTERHHTNCLLTQPEPAEHVIDTHDDNGITPERLARIFDLGFEVVQFYRRLPAA